MNEYIIFKIDYSIKSINANQWITIRIHLVQTKKVQNG